MEDKKVYVVETMKGRVFAVCENAETALKFLQELEDKQNMLGEVKERPLFSKYIPPTTK